MTITVGIDASAVPREPRGAGRYIVELIRTLDRRTQVEIRVQVPRGDTQRWARVAPSAALVARVPHARPARLAWEQAFAPRAIDRWGIDVFHGPHYTMPIRARVPKVVTVHDMTFFDHPEWHERAKVAFFTRAIRAAARRASAVICDSEASASRFRELLRPDVPVHVIHLGVDHSRFNPAPGDDAHVLQVLRVTHPYVAFVGTMEPRKGVGTLVRAFDKIAVDHPEVALLLIGGAGWGPDIEAEVSGAAHGDRIRRMGYVHDGVLPALLRSASVVAYPSFEEGFGMPVLEALACGAPVVTSLGSATEEVAGDAAVLTPVGDVDALASALDRVLRGGSEVDRLRTRGPERASQFTWDATAAAHEVVYRSVAPGGAR